LSGYATLAAYRWSPTHPHPARSPPEAFEAASQEPSLPAADEATMAMPVSEMFDDED